MASNEKVVNNKIVDIIEIYKFCFRHFSMGVCLNNLNFEFQNLITSNINLGY